MFCSIWPTQMIYYLFTSLVLGHMLKVPMTLFDSVALMFAICHMFSRRRHSQNRRIENALFIAKLYGN